MSDFQVKSAARKEERCYLAEYIGLPPTLNCCHVAPMWLLQVPPIHVAMVTRPCGLVTRPSMWSKEDSKILKFKDFLL